MNETLRSEVVRLRDKQGLTYSQIGARLGIAADQARYMVNGSYGVSVRLARVESGQMTVWGAVDSIHKPKLSRDHARGPKMCVGYGEVTDTGFTPGAMACEKLHECHRGVVLYGRPLLCEQMIMREVVRPRHAEPLVTENEMRQVLPDRDW